MTSVSEKTASADETELRDFARRGAYVLLLVAFVLGGALLISADVWLPSSGQVALEAGEAAKRDILAPRALKYESDVLTEAKRQAEVAAVRPIYDPPDARVESEQLQAARQVLDYIENVRFDSFATPEQKSADIGSLVPVNLQPDVVDSMLAIEDEAKWRSIDAQVVRLLERVMSGEIREDNLQARRDELSNLISATYSESDVRIITAIVGDLLRPNTFYNEELTHQAQTQAAESVPVEMRSFASGQMIIRAGEIATPAHIEALEQFGLLRETERRSQRFVGGLLAMALATAGLGGYVTRFHPKLTDDPQLVILLGASFLVALAGLQLLDPNTPVQAYFFPAAGLGFLITTLIGSQFGILSVVTLAALASFASGASLEYVTAIGFMGALGVLALGRTERLNAYFVAGGVVALAGMIVAAAFALSADVPPDVFVVFSKMGASAVNGILSAAVALVGLYVASNALNIPTSLKIVELLQPNHPLLQRLLREAPGTYQHSLQVANLAELGAQLVNANASLLRTAAMYHDVGKILNPHFFVENQADNVNPHDQLGDPWQSARIIIGHVTEGDRLARRYRLPNRIRDFINEHHGTTQVIYFYRQAQEQAGEDVDREEFTYPGPRPQSRETAILMLADGCESSVRARRPQTREDIRETVDYIFEQRLQAGQLDESDLTLNDLRVLRDTFLSALQGVFHPRIAYPGVPGQTVLPAAAVSQLPTGALPPPAQMTQEFELVRAAESPAEGAEAGPGGRPPAKADTISG